MRNGSPDGPAKGAPQVALLASCRSSRARIFSSFSNSFKYGIVLFVRLALILSLTRSCFRSKLGYFSASSSQSRAMYFASALNEDRYSLSSSPNCASQITRRYNVYGSEFLLFPPPFFRLFFVYFLFFFPSLISWVFSPTIPAGWYFLFLPISTEK